MGARVHIDRMLFCALLTSVACGGGKKADPGEQVIITLNRAELDGAQLVQTSLEQGFEGLQGIAASRDGRMIAAQLTSTPGTLTAVITLPDGAGPASIATRAGSVFAAAGGGPLLGNRDELHWNLDDLHKGVSYRVMAELGASYAGIEATGLKTSKLYRTAADAPGLARTVSDTGGAWAILDFHRPSGRVWRVARTPADDPHVRIDALALSPDANTAFVAVSNPAGNLMLAAYDTRAGTVRWQTEIGANRVNGTMLVLSADGAEVVAVIGDPDRCESCERAEVRRVADGQRLHGFTLEPRVGDTTARTGRPNSGTRAGYDGRFLWFYSYQAELTGHRPVTKQCAYEVYDVSRTTGARVRTNATVDARWKQLFEGCSIRAMFPTTDGIVAVRDGDKRSLEIVRASAIP